MRCYDGCPDSELQAKLDAQRDAEARLRLLAPDAHCTYFPAPGYYQVWLHNAPIGGWEHNRTFDDRLDALNDAIGVLST
jgi:hypothetical protein